MHVFHRKNCKDPGDLIEDLNALKNQLEGELHYDALSKSLYATDASVYREIPIAVAIPRHSDDVKKLVAFAQKHKLGLIPRAGGTSLAGQCVGNGLVVDVSKYMNQILEFNKEERWVRVQPGVVRDELNVFLKAHGLFFGPNTSTSNRCNIGGMVGNNSCGSTSIVYGSTRDHVLELKVILSDGSEVVFGSTDSELFRSKQQGNSLESQLYRQISELLQNESNVETINNHFPKRSVTRRNTGYALDSLLNLKPFNATSDVAFNFCKILCGSEGTLALTTEIKLHLVDLPKPFDVVLVAHFKSIDAAMNATVIAMNHAPTACELMDKTILDCTKNQIEHNKNRFFIKGDPEAVLLIEFREYQLDTASEKALQLEQELTRCELAYDHTIISGNQTNQVWELRKAGLGLLANIPGDKKTVACIEDTAVAVNDLPAYINEFSAMMSSFNQKAVYYAHAGAGELHLRPILNLKKSEDVKSFRKISEASARLVKKYHGSLSGEHGDGRVRAEFIPLVLGTENYALFEQIKETWDPLNIFNPGKIVRSKPMDQDLRYEVDRIVPDIETKFNFSETGGILRTVEKCNGSGDCRKLNFAGGTMCPSYRATRDEKDSTRGRANVLREFLTQNTKTNPFDHPEIETAMDLCISCKGCKSECPSNIDMATLKAEFQYQYAKQNQVSFRTKLVAHNAKLNAIASRFPWLHNFLVNKLWIKKGLGIAPERTLPTLEKQTFRRWYATYKQIPRSKKVFLFCDEFTNYYDVSIGQKSVKLLNALGYEVLLPNHPESGRALISKGFLDQAAAIANSQFSIFKDMVSKDCQLVGIEPSAILSFRDEYPNLVSAEKKQEAIELSRNVLLIDEFISNLIDESAVHSNDFTDDRQLIAFHGHCHQKALSTQDHSVKILSLPRNYEVNVIPSGCCGMAGSFGFEKEHYKMSMVIGNQVLFPSVENLAKSTIIAAPGTSCRHQIYDGTTRKSSHPIEILYDALKIKPE